MDRPAQFYRNLRSASKSAAPSRLRFFFFLSNPPIQVTKHLSDTWSKNPPNQQIGQVSLVLWVFGNKFPHTEFIGIESMDQLSNPFCPGRELNRPSTKLASRCVAHLQRLGDAVSRQFPRLQSEINSR